MAKINSHCSSLGHYKIGRERKMYNYPVNAFELDGLDKQTQMPGQEQYSFIRHLVREVLDA